ncbi:MAG: ATP-binding protein [Verrucomicrobiota bacterium]
MSTLTLILIGAIILNLSISLIVYLNNPKRGTNQQFLTLGFAITGWLTTYAFIFSQTSPGGAAFWIQTSGAIGSFVVVAFNLLRLAILFPNLSIFKLYQKSFFWLVLYLLTAIYCYTPLYIQGAIIPKEGVPNIVHGQASLWLLLYFLISLSFLIKNIIYNIRSTQGIQKEELKYVLTGLVSLLCVGIFLAVLLPRITQHYQSTILAPLWVILMNSFIAYGIATKEIMDVGGIFRRILAYAILLAYLLIVYTTTWWVSSMVLNFFDGKSSFTPHLIAAVISVLSMSRAKSFLQVFVNKLFINIHEIDLKQEIQKVDSILPQITTTKDLLEKVSQGLTRSAGTDKISIFLFNQGHLQNVYSTFIKPHNTSFDVEAPLPSILRKTQTPLHRQLIPRFKPSKELTIIDQLLSELDASLAIGIHTKGEIKGLILMAERLSGKMYTRSDLEALQILTNRIATALENAQLYTAVENAKIYNDILLENLVSGIIAIDNSKEVKILNAEAQRLLDQNLSSTNNLVTQDLPDAIQGFIKEIYLNKQEKARNEIELVSENGITRYLQIGGSILKDQTGGNLGTILILHDVSAIKELEQHVKHSEKLATIGKLSASMVHEIKNPLVAIKTFTQLIPERRNDEEFIKSFSHLVGKEVDRIEKTIKGLLEYTKPSKPYFQTISLHLVLKEVTSLLNAQISKHRIQLSLALNAEDDFIKADQDQLKQIFVNLLLNSCDAMKEEGKILIITHPQKNSTRASRKAIKMTIEDNGEGIPKENLENIFDPFFTTKRTGTGLGLSLTYNLVMAHNGKIRVESAMSRGTSFHLEFPLKNKANRNE